jgi:hypothetical protein
MTPDFVSLALHEISPTLTYDWVAILTDVTLGVTKVSTSLVPHGRDYAIPVTLALRETEGVGLGDRGNITVRVRL